MGHVYGTSFMTASDKSSQYAGRIVVRLLQQWFPAIGSVLDVGCARGTWLSIWQEAGVDDIQGLDGDYVQKTAGGLIIPAEKFASADLSESIALNRSFGVVQSLEVAEHINEACADIFVDNLVRHSDGLVLFSAAPPGQGGEHHVNEQPYDYWRAKFAKCGYQAFDCVRPNLVGDPAISFWYRYNMMLYVRNDRITDLPNDVKKTQVANGSPIPDISPFAFRMRKLLVRSMPATVQDMLARLKVFVVSRRAASKPSS